MPQAAFTMPESDLEPGDGGVVSVIARPEPIVVGDAIDWYKRERRSRGGVLLVGFG